MISLSVVVPVYNDEGNVAELPKEIKEVCEKANYDFEIIFINDGSADQTDAIYRMLRPLKYIQFRRNFWQTAAMDAGIKASAKEFIATLDGDMQNDPHDIPRMIEYLLVYDGIHDSGCSLKVYRKDCLKALIYMGNNIVLFR